MTTARKTFWLALPHRFLQVAIGHIHLGPDQLGRDTLSRLLYAIRFSMVIALGGTVIGAVLGTLMGFLAAHFRGWVEEVIMMMVDVQASLPYLIIALAPSRCLAAIYEFSS